MPILGTIVNKVTSARAAGMLASSALGGSNLTLSTLAHSLPATNPEALFMQLRSYGGGDDYATPVLLGLGGNASLATVGFGGGGVSQNTMPTLAYTAWLMVFHSIIR